MATTTSLITTARLARSPAQKTSEPIIPTRDYYDELAKSYESAFSHDTGLQSFIQHALEQMLPHSRVLDIGCGTGKPVSWTMAAHGHQVHGIDLSPAMIKTCRQQVPTATFTATNMLEYDDDNDNEGSTEQADVVFAIFSLFCLSRAELARMLDKMAGWLAPGGWLCLGTICAEDLRTTRDMFDANGRCASGVEMTFMGARTLMTAFTRDGWRFMVERAGFEIVHTAADLFVPRRAPEVASDDEMHYYIMARKREG
ncbi:methyltransferase type 11 [Phlyctema vagabunda]|uniref:phosphoethanolamine N-methyltransferase n=1 Tax=Phlyctema vagabunda TaxID=108571 RepID=A0ABR4PCB1_9HELO